MEGQTLSLLELLATAKKLSPMSETNLRRGKWANYYCRLGFETWYRMAKQQQSANKSLTL